MRVEGRNGDTIPEPGKHDGGGFAEPGRDVDQLRFAIRAVAQPIVVALALWTFTTGEPALVIERAIGYPCRCGKEFGEIHARGRDSAEMKANVKRYNFRREPLPSGMHP